MTASGDGFRVRILALTAIVGLIASGGTAWWSFDRGESILGPTALCTDGAHIWVVSNGQLIRTDADGRDPIVVETSIDVGTLCEIAALPDGRLLVADWDRVRILDPNNDLITPFSTHSHAGAVDLAVGDGVVYLSTNKGHRVDVFDMQGTLVKEGQPGLHRYPNDLALGPDGKLWVADTNRHMISVVDTAPMGFDTPVREVPFHGRGHTWPISVAVTREGDAWAVVANSQLADGRLVRIGRNNEVGYRDIDGLRPLTLLATERGVLVGDMETIALEWVWPDRAPFGDEAFQAGLDRARDERAGYRLYRTVSLVMMGLMSVLAVVTVFLDARDRGRPRSAAAQTGLLEPARGPLIGMAAVGGIITLAVIGMMLFFASSGPRLVVVMAGMIPIGLMMIFVSTALTKTRIGQRDGRFIVVDHRGRQVLARPARVRYSDRVLVVDGTAVLTQAGIFPLFDRARMTGEINPLLVDSRPMGLWESEWALLRDRHPVAFLPLLVFVPILLHIGVLLIAF